MSEFTKNKTYIVNIKQRNILYWLYINNTIWYSNIICIIKLSIYDLIIRILIIYKVWGA